MVDKDNNNLKGFALAGSDNKWYWVTKGVIRKDTVILTCDQVKTPVKVRYAWADYPIATPLYNGAGLPAISFQSDIPKEGATAVHYTLNRPAEVHPERFYIQSKSDLHVLASGINKLDVRIFTLSGKLVLIKKLESATALGDVTIPVANLKSGSYFIQCKMDNSIKNGYFNIFKISD